MDRYNLVFIPLMGNVDKVKVAFEVFQIANNKKLFTEDEQAEIKKCQYIVAQIIAENDEKLLNEYWEIIKMNNNFLQKYEEDLINRTTKEVTETVTEKVSEDTSKTIAKNLKNILPDKEIAKHTGLTLKQVQEL